MGLAVYKWLLPVALVWGGGQALFTKLRHGERVSLDLATFVRTKPDAKWLTLTSGELDASRRFELRMLGTGPVREVFTPLVDPTVKGGLIHVLVVHEADDAVALPVSGLVRFGIDLRDKDVRKIEAAFPEALAPGYVILEAGAAPGWGLAWMFPLGLLAFGWNLSRWLKRREDERLEKLTAP